MVYSGDDCPYCPLALKNLTPDSNLDAFSIQLLRVCPSPARPLPTTYCPCLLAQLVSLISLASTVFPPAAACMAAYRQTQQPPDPLNHLDPTHPSTEQSCHSQWKSGHDLHRSYATAQHAHEGPKLCHPRLLLTGAMGHGHVHLAAAFMDAMPEVPVLSLSLTQLWGCPTGRSPEEIVTCFFAEARRCDRVRVSLFCSSSSDTKVDVGETDQLC